MAGGIGSRFWPVSRARNPKQFLDMDGSGSLLRKTYDRLRRVIPEDHIIVATLSRYRSAVKEQLPQLPNGNLLMEPYNRNTAPCLAYAAYTLLKRDPEAVMVVAPADHLISGEDEFEKILRSAFEYAESSGELVAIGIVPTRPDANFGYIQMASPSRDGRPVKIKTFTEKPDTALAELFISTGEFLWNSGIFVWTAAAIKEELERLAPEAAHLFRGWEDVIGGPGEREFIERIYTDMPRLAIDYAVMEKTGRARVLPATFGWSDFGTWEAWHERACQGNPDENAVRVDGKTLLRDASRDIIICDDPHKLIAIRGLDNYVVVDTDDVLMICPRGNGPQKDFTADLALPDYEEFR